MNENMKLPGKKWYGLAILILLTGVIVLIKSIVSTVGTGERVIIPGSELLNLESKGTYTIYYELNFRRLK